MAVSYTHLDVYKRQDYIIVMGNIVPMDTSSQLVDGRTYLPIRAVLEAFDADVTWSNGTVSVTSPNRYNFDNIYVNDRCV